MDPMHLQAWTAAEQADNEVAARRAVIDQVASLSDARALVLHAVSH
jgi:dGTPase